VYQVTEDQLRSIQVVGTDASDALAFGLACLGVAFTALVAFPALRDTPKSILWPLGMLVATFTFGPLGLYGVFRWWRKRGRSQQIVDDIKKRAVGVVMTYQPRPQDLPPTPPPR